MPREVARGPFQGMQGGAIAALMCHEIDLASASTGRWQFANVVSSFLRPVPLEPLNVSVIPRRVGRRVAIYDAELSSAGVVLGLQRATLIRPQTDRNIPEPPEERATPSDFPEARRPSPHGERWMMEEMEVRFESERITWFHMNAPIADGACCVANLLPPVDWTHGLAPPEGARDRPNFAIPNTDLAVHLLREPVGEWVGIEHKNAWSSDSIGVGWGRIRDMQGLVGCVAMSIAITPT